MATIKKKNKDRYTYGFKWEIWYNASNPSDWSWELVYNDDGIDDPMGEVVKSGSYYVAEPNTPRPSKRFKTLTDAKRYIEGEFGIEITKKRTVKKTATKSATKKRTVKRK